MLPVPLPPKLLPGSGSACSPVASSTVPARQLTGLPTPELIGQYDWALRDFKGRQTNTSPRQKRINFIVDLLSARADAGDAEANAWLGVS